MSEASASFTPAPAALGHLRAADPLLGAIIDRIGPLSISLETDYFASLAGAIVRQQLSNAAAATIWKRFEAALGGVTPAAILGTAEESLRSAGLSRAKVAYLRDLAVHVADGRLDLAHISGLPDEEAIARLTEVKGVGRWTAEMFLIFSLGRPDVLALDDGALRGAVARLYGLPGLDRDAVEYVGERWKPHRTTASLYLWKALDLWRAKLRTS